MLPPALCNGCHNNNSGTKRKNKTLLFEHQKSAHLTIFVRREWSHFVATKAFRAEYICIDYGENSRCPYMELGQAFYSRILGVNFLS